MMSVDYAQPRVPLSLRLPKHVVERVDEYARAHRVSKTDAFLHFLQKGMAVDDRADSALELGEIKEQLLQIKQMLSGEAVISSEESQKTVRDAVARAAATFPAIRRAYLFGSFARRDFNEESDVDIRIEVDTEIPFTLHDLAQFQKSVERVTGRNVDVVSAQNLKSKNLAAAIKRDKVLIYER